MNTPYFDLSGKVAIVTGGAAGIGRGIAEGLADVGATIALAARRLENLERACGEIAARTGVQTRPYRADITSARDVERLAREVEREFGRIDILVNNAGVGGSEKPILKMDDHDWDSVMDANLKGAFRLSRAVAAGMARRNQGGKIINVTSIGSRVVFKNMSAYCAGKAALTHLTKVMAMEWARYDIQVNAILPGYFETPMNRDFFAQDAGKNLIKSDIPMRRIGRIEEVKGVAVLLASAASSFMTGSTIVIDGGQSLR